MSKNNNNTPRLRFPGFTGEWVEKKLGELLTYEQPTPYLVTDTNYKKSGIPVLTAGKTFILGYTDETHGVYDNLPVIIFDDFVTESKFVDFPFKVKSSAMKMLKLLDENNNLHLIYELMQLLQYPVKEHKRYWISEYSRLTIPLPPSPAEQQKIASCLSAMDDLIAAQAEKVEALKEKKMGLMQQLFPQPGETTPRLRFPGFTEEWVECTLGEVGDVCMCKRVMKGETNSTSGIPFYKIGTFGKTPDAYIPKELFLEYKKRYSYPSKGDILFSAAGTIGRCVVFDGEPAYFQDSNIVWISNDEKKVHNSFLKYIYSFVDWKIDDGGIVKRLYNDSIRKTSFLKPSLEEQQKIADCLSELDDLIASETKQLEALKDHKKGLMQQLFPQPAK